MKRFIIYFAGLFYIEDAIDEEHAKKMFLYRFPNGNLNDIEKIEIIK